MNPSQHHAQSSHLTPASLLPPTLPQFHQLHPSNQLTTIFDHCHQYIYANEGLLKTSIFHELVKLLLLKLYDEQHHSNALSFGITANEYQAVSTQQPNTFLPRLTALFNQVQRCYAQFIPAHTASRFTPLTLAYVVNQLQWLNLTQTPGDIKGSAFQTLIHRHQRSERGAFFTPPPVVQLAIALIDPQPHERIIDPACGSGGFLIAALNHLTQQSLPTFNRTKYIQHCLMGIEFNPDVAQAALLRLLFEGGSGSELICANSLIGLENQYNQFDLVLTNPPFGNKGKVTDRTILRPYQLAKKWQKVNDTWQPTQYELSGQTPDVLLLEQCVNLLRPGGRLAIILPDGLLQNNSHAPMRVWWRSHMDICAIISLPQETFVPYGTSIKTSLIIAQKRPTHRAYCFMARIKHIGYTVKGQPCYQRDAHGQIIQTAAGSPLIDSDINTIVHAFTAFTNDQSIADDDRHFVVTQTAITSRLDVEFYLPSGQHLLHQLINAGAQPLSEFVQFVTKADSFRFTAAGTIRYIAIADVDYRTMQVIRQQLLNVSDVPSRATYRLCENDIIVAIAGANTGSPRQATAWIGADAAGAICSNGFAVLRAIHDIEPLFLLAYMRTATCLRQIKRLVTGHAIPAIALDDLATVLVPIPPVAEQRRIAMLIADMQRQQRILLMTGEQVIQATQHLLTAQCRVV
ncbi:N-6 DNA methylase [Rhodoferax sp. 4810]|uniref:N-6 DNA methylase n=1 Tax=Thiospirillum jenense TaxID=1653858 RepID=A0A839H908_9GAMM|nr:N-6 DNA methylase [Thiospirillum jenense]MBB1073959.1 N-6 DNA methylase [Rhodoferax jenense]MBB1125835.1 N-6 DNA methylase [Thiospirillum jenense]